MATTFHQRARAFFVELLDQASERDFASAFLYSGPHMAELIDGRPAAAHLAEPLTALRKEARALRRAIFENETLPQLRDVVRRFAPAAELVYNPQAVMPLRLVADGETIAEWNPEWTIQSSSFEHAIVRARSAEVESELRAALDLLA